MVCAACAILDAHGGGTTNYYRNVTVTAKTGEGVVYATDSPTPPGDAEYTETCTREFSNTAETQDIYLWAKPAGDLAFLYWEDGSGATVNAPYVSLKGVSDQATAPSYTYTAVFGKAPAVSVVSDNPALGSASIDKIVNDTGDEVTITAAKLMPRTGEMGRNWSKSNVFEGWYDKDGNCVSTDLKYTFTISGPNVYTARFKWRKFLSGPGYYRVRWAPLQEFVTVFGAYRPTIGIQSSSRHLDGLLQFTTDHTNPASVLRIEGNYTDISEYTPETEVMTNVNLFGQDVDTEGIMGMTLKIKTAHNPGYYKFVYNSYNIGAWSHGSVMSEGGKTIFLTSDKPSDNINDPNSYFDLEPLTEEYADEFWFGAGASEGMAYDGGYWTSMYASFPYMCYGPDGVEAYIVREVRPSREANMVVLDKIESGIVPPNTAVLLKCVDFFRNTKPLLPQNRLIPLDPDDARIDPSVAEGNLLKGVYQLNTSHPETSNPTPGHIAFDEATMRVFSADAEGVVGFYKLPAGTPGEAVRLLANKAYLDLTALSVQSSMPFRIVCPGADGVSDVVLDERAAPAGIYDMYGRRVAEYDMVPGHLYIVNGRKTLCR